METDALVFNWGKDSADHDLCSFLDLIQDELVSVLQAATYGKCVAATTTGKQELRKDMCAKEFEALKTCFTAAAKKKAK
ncbi:putative protein C17orf89 [Liparis tanakae]|uniref:NADH dehydrogenase [ubiquinone] 1 alpha subcomplex assembly factor 8 n=1 Tax=Liparis tanakae TaxID=230148 RepID=A0A4Z2I956_9TELE|nr:putative protein C17orf89 [Liparis tanakae]